MSRREFSVATKKAATKRANGHCENKECGLPFSASNPPEHDHDTPNALKSEHMRRPIDSLENCVVLCRACHRAKTTNQDRTKIDKATRLRNKRLGLTPEKPKWPSKNFRGEINWNR